MEQIYFVDCIEADQIDLLLISHFHLDHAGALPWFLQKTTFRGKCYMILVLPNGTGPGVVPFNFYFPGSPGNGTDSAR